MATGVAAASQGPGWVWPEAWMAQGHFLKVKGWIAP